MYNCHVLDKNVININFCCRFSIFLSINVRKHIIIHSHTNFQTTFITYLLFIHQLPKPMIFLAKHITLLTTSGKTMCIHFCISPLLHHYPLLIWPLISHNWIIFTPTTSDISYVAIAIIVRLFWESLFRFW